MRKGLWILLALVVRAGRVPPRPGALARGAVRSARAGLAESAGQVAPGLSVRGVLGRLQNAGALQCAMCTQLYLRLTGRTRTIKAGDYEIDAHASPSDVIELFEQGRVVLEQLTVVEGTRFSDLRQQLTAQSARAFAAGGSQRCASDGRHRPPGRGPGRAVLSGHLPLRRRHHRCGNPGARL